MIILITGASHTGKTLLAQKLLEKYKYPYLSADHLKMGLIRSGQTNLTPYDDEALTECLWRIIKEMIKTAVENGQNLIVEGCYIPFDWQESFDAEYLSAIRYVCLIFSETYIRIHFADIIAYENVIEHRLTAPDFSMDAVISENQRNLAACRQRGLPCILIDGTYDIGRIADMI